MSGTVLVAQLEFPDFVPEGGGTLVVFFFERFLQLPVKILELLRLRWWRGLLRLLLLRRSRRLFILIFIRSEGGFVHHR